MNGCLSSRCPASSELLWCWRTRCRGRGDHTPRVPHAVCGGGLPGSLALMRGRGRGVVPWGPAGAPSPVLAGLLPPQRGAHSCLEGAGPGSGVSFCQPPAVPGRFPETVPARAESGSSALHTHTHAALAPCSSVPGIGLNSLPAVTACKPRIHSFILFVRYGTMQEAEGTVLHRHRSATCGLAAGLSLGTHIGPMSARTLSGDTRRTRVHADSLQGTPPSLLTRWPLEKRSRTVLLHISLECSNSSRTT